MVALGQVGPLVGHHRGQLAVVDSATIPDDSTSSGRAPGMQKAAGAGGSSGRASAHRRADEELQQLAVPAPRRAVRTNDR